MARALIRLIILASSITSRPVRAITEALGLGRGCMTGEPPTRIRVADRRIEHDDYLRAPQEVLDDRAT